MEKSALSTEDEFTKNSWKKLIVLAVLNSPLFVRFVFYIFYESTLSKQMDRPPIEANTLDHVLRTDSIEDERTCETSIAF